RRIRQTETGRDDASDGIKSRALERNEALLRLNPEGPLGQLANETGGFLIHDTNDAASAFNRIEEDMRFHYLLAYSPSNESYDGKFRTISVKVSRPGLQVQTRQGYFAVRAVESAPLRSYEAPALAQLDAITRPHAFPLETVALSFPTAKQPGLVPVLVRVPGSAVTYQLDKQDKSGKKMHLADLVVVARVKNEAGHEVDRLSQHYALSAAADKLEAARRGDVLFYRLADLPPGRYTVEAVAYDAQSQKGSVTTAALEVPASQEGRARLSSVVLVGRAEKVTPAEAQSNSPLIYGDTQIYPNMGEPFRKSTSSAVGFFFTLYGVKDAVPPAQATIEVFRGGQGAGRVTASLPAPDATGRIQYAGALPLQSFPVGAYTLKVTATTGSGVDTRQAAFTVTE
ncbi:MAG TPA: VWA domain-containing protein, partial [Vicinamibacteria bacterium]|nr:VWA domain-containing protein [Vicinamibacteria bacterium]